MDIQVETSFGTKITITLKGDDLKVWDAFKTEIEAQKFCDLHLYQETDAWQVASKLVGYGHFSKENPFPSIQWLEQCEFMNWDSFVAWNAQDWYEEEFDLNLRKCLFINLMKSEYILHCLARGFRFQMNGNDANKHSQSISLENYIFEEEDFVIKLPSKE